MLHKIYIGAIAAIVLTAGFFFARYEIQIARADEQQKATDKVIAAKDQALADRDKAFQDFKAQMQQQINTLSAKQATIVLTPTVGGTAPQTVTKGDLPPEISKTLPGPANGNFTLISDEQMIKLGQRELTCQVTEAGLTRCDADKADMKAQIDVLTKANESWKKAGAVGPWMAAAGFSRNAAGNGYSPNLFIQRRITSNWGIMAGVQGRGDLSISLTRNFGSK